MANRKYVERVRDRMSGVKRMADDMNMGEFDGELEMAILSIRQSIGYLDDWLVKDRLRRPRARMRLIRINDDCVVRRKAS